MHDGAKYHTRQATKHFVAVHRARSTGEPLPSYAPDDNPIAYLWKKTKQRATHHPYCKACVELTVSGEKALAFVATHSNEVLGLFGGYCKESGLDLQQAA
jgi:transposase